MRLLVLTPPNTGKLLQSFSTAIASTLSLDGHETARLDLVATGLDGFCRSAAAADGDQPVTAETSIGKVLFARFRPNILLVPVGRGGAAKAKTALVPFLSDLLAGYLLLPQPEGRFRLLDVARGKRFLLAENDARRAATVLRSSMMDLARIPEETLDPAGREAQLLAETAIRLRAHSEQRADAGRQTALPPKLKQRGTIESVADGEILRSDTLWVKGWIDWDETRFASLILRVADREWPLAISGFRHDAFAAGEVEQPMGFAAEVDVGHVACAADLSVWIEDRAGFRREWQRRAFWISREDSLQSETPLIRGEARLVHGKISCEPVSDGSRVSRLLAWQDGHLVAGWHAPEAGQETTVPGGIVLDVASVPNKRSLIHLHVTFEGRTSVCWTALDPATGLPPVATRFNGTALAKDDGLDLVRDLQRIPLPEGASSLFLDGKPVGTYRNTVGAKGPPIEIEDCAGLAILEAAGADGGRRTIRLLRLRRDAAVSQGLPAFVMPQAGKPVAAASNTGDRIRVVLIRQTSAPTDELYVLSGLDVLAKRHEIDLRIVDLNDDTTSAKQRDALLCKGAFVIVSRYLSNGWIAAIARLQSRLAGIFYLMDDDVTLAQNDRHMPAHYRNRMIGVAHGEFQALLHLATRFIVTSDFLATRFVSDKTELLTPPYIRPCESFEHLDDMSKIRIEYHGTQVHRADLDAVASALVQIHDLYPQARIRSFMGRFAPQSLRGLDRVEIMPELPWAKYCATVAASRAHIALAPMLGTPYNRAKSFVKIMDIARLGAVGLYSRSVPYDSVVTHGENGFLLENDAKVWSYALAWLIENPDELRRMALAGQDLAWSLSAANHPAAYWARHFFGKAEFDKADHLGTAGVI